jgi:type IV conjugative transfer system coupling protein TraD
MRKSAIGSFTRGGQFFLNLLDQTNEVLNRSWRGLLVVFVFIALTFAWMRAPAYDRYLLGRWMVATFWAQSANNAGKPVPVILPDAQGLPKGQTIIVSADQFPQSPRAKKMLSGFLYRLILGSVIGFIFNMCAFFIMAWQMKRAGHDLIQDKHIRGPQLRDARVVADELSRRGPHGVVEIGPLRVPAKYETEHFLFTGSSGSGKTNAINIALAGVRKAGQKAVVYDVPGDFIAKFYRPGKDIILNPLDSRGAAWSIWSEVRENSAYDFDKIAESLSPLASKQDSFWALAPRQLLKGLAKKLLLEGRASNAELYHRVSIMELGELISYVQGTQAAGVMSEEAERTSANVRMELISRFEPFQYLADPVPGQRGFSIREWLAQDDDSWLFISSSAEMQSTLSPLVSLWIDLVAVGILSLSPHQKDRRTWLAIDELATLSQLPSLLKLLKEGRKYGAAVMVGNLSMSDLAAIYGKDTAESLAGGCNTTVVFKTTDLYTGKWAETLFGQFEQIETNESLMSGPSEYRDGVSLNQSRVLRPLVLDAEVRNQEPLHAYVRFGRQIPLCQVEYGYLAIPDREPAYNRKAVPIALAPSRPVPLLVPAPPSDSFAPRLVVSAEGDILEPLAAPSAAPTPISATPDWFSMPVVTSEAEENADKPAKAGGKKGVATTRRGRAAHQERRAATLRSAYGSLPQAETPGSVSDTGENTGETG